MNSGHKWWDDHGIELNETSEDQNRGSYRRKFEFEPIRGERLLLRSKIDDKYKNRKYTDTLNAIS